MPPADRDGAAVPPPPSVQAAETRAAQRGFVVITGAKIWFLLTATVLNIGLPRLLGDPARFGDFAVVNTFISILNMVVLTGALQVVSKRVSESPDNAWAVRRGALRLMGGVGLVLLIALVAGADLISRVLFRDPSLATLLRVASAITVAYGIYAVLIGLLNGLKQFTRQAMFDMTFATLKLGLILALVLAGFSVLGALAGFALAATLIAAAAYVLTRPLVPRPAGPPAPVALGAFMLQVMGYTLLINVLLQGDVLVVKAATLGPVLDALTQGHDRLGALVAATGLDPSGLPEALAAESTAILSGLYRATKNVSLISYQAVIAITFVIFPLISRATFQVDRDATRAYVRQTFRAASLLVALVATLLAAGGEPLLAFLFGDAYRVATPALLPLLGAMACFALLFVLANILTAGGHPLDAMLLAAAAVAIQLVALFVVLAGTTAGPAVLSNAALVTLGSIAVSLVAGCVVVVRRFATPLPVLNLARIGAASALALAALIPVGLEGIPGIFVRFAIAGVVFVGVILASREVTKDELALVTRVLLRR
jgi:stage V sporulation protein B